MTGPEVAAERPNCPTSDEIGATGERAICATFGHSEGDHSFTNCGAPCKDAIAEAIATKPDVAILDYRLPLIDGIEATRQIRHRASSVEVLIFTMHEDEKLLHDLWAAGARGYVLKSDAPQHLIAAIQALADHKPFFTARASELLLATFVGQV